MNHCNFHLPIVQVHKISFRFHVNSIPQQRPKGPQFLEPVFFVLEPLLFFPLQIPLRARHVLGLDVDDLDAAVPENGNGNILPRSCQVDQAAGVAGGFHLFRTDLLDNVLFFQPAQMDGRLAVDLVDEGPEHLWDLVGVVTGGVGISINISIVPIVFAGPIGRAGGQLASQIPVADFLSVGQIVHNVSDSVDGDCKARSLHVGPNGGVDADDLPALDVDQRAACFVI